MSDEEDDYLSDKFLLESQPTQAPKTYSQLRKDAHKRSQHKDENHRKKGHKEIREEGLSKSLFERAKEEEPSSGGNKALMMMMKMGFKPGQSLGKVEDERPKGEDELRSESPVAPNQHGPSRDALYKPDPLVDVETVSTSTSIQKSHAHRTEPIPLNEWTGRQGIGTSRKLKRGPSPTSEERVAKMAKMAEDSAAAQEDFRTRTRFEYEERRAEGRLAPAQRTCVTLDEKAGKQFHALWLNPGNPESFPPGLILALNMHATLTHVTQSNKEDPLSLSARLRQEMQSNALTPLGQDDNHPENENPPLNPEFSQDVLDEAAQFLRLQARDRLNLVLTYLRDEYAYCFWCGTQYEGQDDMENQCPGTDEDSHD